MRIYKRADVLAVLQDLLSSQGLTMDEFRTLGEREELIEVDEELDYAYRHLLPLTDPVDAA